MKTQIVFFLIFCLWNLTALTAQKEQKLLLINKSEVEMASLFSKRLIKKVTLDKEKEYSSTITVHFNAHPEKEYSIEAMLLGPHKKPNELIGLEITEVGTDMELIKITFRLDKNQLEEPDQFFKTKYVRLNVREQNSDSEGLGGLLEGITGDEIKYIYKHQRRWPLTPVVAEVEEEEIIKVEPPKLVSVKLMPYSSAINIQQ